DPTALLPLLEARHSKRAANDKEWQALQADIADVRKLRAETTISLNENARRAERDEQEAKRRERHPEIAEATAPSVKEKAESADRSKLTGQTDPNRDLIPGESHVTTKQSAKTIANAEDRKAADPDAVNQVATATVGSSNAAKTTKRGDSSHQDDGL